MTDNAFAAAGGLFAKGDGIDTLWNIENLRFCTGIDAAGNCNAFTDRSVAPSATVTPTSIAFPNTNVGATSAVRNINVLNAGVATLNVTGVTVSGPAPPRSPPRRRLAAPPSPRAPRAPWP